MFETRARQQGVPVEAILDKLAPFYPRGAGLPLAFAACV